MGNQSSSEGGRPFGRCGNSLGLSRSELEKRCKPSGYVSPFASCSFRNPGLRFLRANISRDVRNPRLNQSNDVIGPSSLEIVLISRLVCSVGSVFFLLCLVCTTIVNGTTRPFDDWWEMANLPHDRKEAKIERRISIKSAPFVFCITWISMLPSVAVRMFVRNVSCKSVRRKKNMPLAHFATAINSL